MKYLQCHLRRENTHTVAWLPSWAANAGNEIQLADSDTPKLFWKIVVVGDTEREVRQNERNFKQFQGGGIDQ